VRGAWKNQKRFWDLGETKGNKKKDYNSFVLRAARLIRKKKNQQEYKVGLI
jgi:hypothetical protein